MNILTQTNPAMYIYIIDFYYCYIYIYIIYICSRHVLLCVFCFSIYAAKDHAPAQAPHQIAPLQTEAIPHFHWTGLSRKQHIEKANTSNLIWIDLGFPFSVITKGQTWDSSDVHYQPVYCTIIMSLVPVPSLGCEVPRLDDPGVRHQGTGFTHRFKG